MVAKQRKSWIQDDGFTRIEGHNVPPYPIHHFAYVKAMRYDFGWPLQVVSSGDDEWCDGCSRKRFNSPIFAVELVTEGVFHFGQNGRTHDVPPDSVFLVHPGADSVMRLASGSYGRKKVMEITGPLLPSLLGLTGLNKVDTLRPTHLEWLVAQYDRAHATLRDMPDDFMRDCSILAYTVMIELGRSAVRGRLPIVLRQVVDLMEHNIASRLTIRDLCEHANLSKATLHRLFTKHLGASPMDYFINLKIDVARSLLAGPATSIKEVARQLGYDDQLYFSALFKKHVGLSPRDFQQRSRPANASRQTVEPCIASIMPPLHQVRTETRQARGR